MSIFIKSEKQQWVVETKDLEEKDYSIKKVTNTGIMSRHVENNHEKWQFFFPLEKLRKKLSIERKLLKCQEAGRVHSASFTFFH